MGRKALSYAEKRAKRQEIIDAAARLFGKGVYSAITMSSIAREAGVAKGTVYLYFRTKEELFLALLVDRLHGWFGEYAPILRTLPSPMHPRDLAAVLAKVLGGFNFEYQSALWWALISSTQRRIIVHIIMRGSEG